MYTEQYTVFKMDAFPKGKYVKCASCGVTFEVRSNKDFIKLGPNFYCNVACMQSPSTK